MVTDEQQNTEPLVDKEYEPERLTQSGFARAVGIEPSRVSELVRKRRIPEVIREEVNGRIQSFVPNKRCIVPPRNPAYIRTNEPTARYLLSQRRAIELEREHGIVDEEEYRARLHELDMNPEIELKTLLLTRQISEHEYNARLKGEVKESSVPSPEEFKEVAEPSSTYETPSHEEVQKQEQVTVEVPNEGTSSSTVQLEKGNKITLTITINTE